MQIGISLLTTGASKMYRPLVDLATRAEALGFAQCGSTTTSFNAATCSAASGTSPITSRSPSSVYVAARTERVSLGTRARATVHNPIRLDKTARPWTC